MSYDEQDPDIRRARWEVRRFKQHLVTYVAVVGLLFFINFFSGGFWRGDFWFFWVAVIWGVFLALQAAHLFGNDIGREWEERMVDRVVARRREDAAARAERYRPSPEPPRPPEPPPAAGGS